MSNFYFTDDVIATVKIQMEITQQDIADIIITSFEGGSNYWMGLDNTQPEFENKPKDVSLSEWTASLLLDKKVIHLYDIEDEDERWILTLDKLIKGIQQNAIERPYNFNTEVWDAEDTDYIIQYALFDKIVYN